MHNSASFPFISVSPICRPCALRRNLLHAAQRPCHAVRRHSRAVPHFHVLHGRRRRVQPVHTRCTSFLLSGEASSLLFSSLLAVSGRAACWHPDGGKSSDHGGAGHIHFGSQSTSNDMLLLWALTWCIVVDVCFPVCSVDGAQCCVDQQLWLADRLHRHCNHRCPTDSCPSFTPSRCICSCLPCRLRSPDIAIASPALINPFQICSQPDAGPCASGTYAPSCGVTGYSCDKSGNAGTGGVYVFQCLVGLCPTQCLPCPAGSACDEGCHMTLQMRLMLIQRNAPGIQTVCPAGTAALGDPTCSSCLPGTYASTSASSNWHAPICAKIKQA